MSAVRFLAPLILSAAPLFSQAPSILDGGIINGASFAKGQGVAAGSLVSIFGSNFATSLALADSIPLATALGGIQVKFNGVPAPLIAVIPGGGGSAPDQINAQLPWGVLPQGVTQGSATVVVTRGAASSNVGTVSILPVAPGIFSVQFGVGVAIAINSDGSLAAPANSIAGLATRPAVVGDQQGLMILGTGIGAVSPPEPDGQSSLDQLRTAVTTPTVLVGNVPVQVTFAGMSPQFPGVNQINIFLPAGTPVGDAVPLQIVMGSITTTDQVTIAVRNP